MSPPIAYFGIESKSLSLVIDLLILFVVVLYFSLLYWTYADARRRIADPMLVGCATVASLWLNGCFLESGSAGSARPVNDQAVSISAAITPDMRSVMTQLPVMFLALDRVPARHGRAAPRYYARRLPSVNLTFASTNKHANDCRRCAI